MNTPLIKAFNYALDELSRLEVPGLPQFQESRRIVFVRSGPNHTASKCYLQGSHEPDIVLIRWDVFKEQHKGIEISYPRSHDSDACCKPEFCVSWRNVLSTLEVRPGSSQASGELGRNRQVAGPSESSSPALLVMVREEYPNYHCTSVFPARPSSHTH